MVKTQQEGEPEPHLVLECCRERAAAALPTVRHYEVLMFSVVEMHYFV